MASLLASTSPLMAVSSHQAAISSAWKFGTGAMVPERLSKKQRSDCQVLGYEFSSVGWLWLRGAKSQDESKGQYWKTGDPEFQRT